MRLVVTSWCRFEATSDGIVWTPNQWAYPVWARYLEVFESVRVVARVRAVQDRPPGWLRADGEGVSFERVPYFVGPLQYLLRHCQVRRAAQSAVGPNDAVILNGSSVLDRCIERLLRGTGRPFGVQVITDLYEAFGPGLFKHPLRPFFRWWFTRTLQRLCHQACAAAYVSKQSLQLRYPCPNFSVYFSNVELPDSAQLPAPRPQRRQPGRFTVITVGSLEHFIKGTHVLIDAVAACLRGGLDLQLVVVGDGKHRPDLEAQAAALGLGDRVRFLGQLPAGDVVRSQLDAADLFILPSFTEGMPRAMIEAMARALPCIGSQVGGIPELLAGEDLVPPGNRSALAAKIHTVATDPQRLARMSARNLEEAKQYGEAVLRPRRLAFYRHVRDMTRTWLHQTTGEAITGEPLLKGS
jgi:glycosyltransferase involved in cell wall biosynthesis